MSAHRPHQPPRLSPADAAVIRAFARHRAPLRAGDGEFVLVSPPLLADPVYFALSAPAGAATLMAPRELVAALLTRLDPLAPSTREDVAALLLELAIEPILSLLAAAAPALDASWAAAEGGTAAAASLGLACRLAGVDGVVRLDLDGPAASEVARQLARWPGRRVPMPDIPIPLSVRMLAMTLSVAELRSLGEGDVLLPDGLGTGDLLLTVGERLAWRARREGRMVHLTSIRFAPRCMGLEEWVMGDTAGKLIGFGTGPGTRDDIEADAGIEMLPVRIVFELGRLELPLGELEQVGPGHVFELGRDPGESVDLVANGRRIGRGRLVEVGGAIGVQVVWIGRDG